MSSALGVPFGVPFNDALWHELAQTVKGNIGKSLFFLYYDKNCHKGSNPCPSAIF